MDVAFARHLRKNLSLVEKILWISLRNRRFHGFKFRRQQPFGVYIADFVCFEKKFILELDGPHHQDQKAYDQNRDEWLQKAGFRVFRFTNEEFLGNEEKGLKKITR